MALRTGWLSFLRRLSRLQNPVSRTRRRPVRGLWRQIASLEHRVLLSSTPTLVKDLTPGVTIGNSSIDGVATVGSQVFFSISTPTGGTELYVSDGTAAGTELVRSFQVDTQIESMIAFNGELYFAAGDGVHGEELWKSDGTTSGTVLVKDIFVGKDSSYVSDLTVVGNELFFVAENELNGEELWKTDGTSAGTVVIDLVSGSGSSSPSQLTEMEGRLYFSAYEASTGRELWSSDGTAAGTMLMDDIRPGAYSSYPSNLTDVGGTLYFRATDGVSGTELWKSDGTPGSSELVKDLRAGTSGSNPENLVALDGKLFFTADDGFQGVELWSSDGTVGGTGVIYDIYPAGQGSYPSQLTVFDGRIFFVVNDPIHDVELWASDGTFAGTDPITGTLSGDVVITEGPLAVVGDSLFFTVSNTAYGVEVWKTDGTQGGTEVVKDINPGSAGAEVAALTPFNDSLFFVANDGVHGIEPWISDGSQAGTVLVLDLTPPLGESTPITSAVDVNGTLYFVADDPVNGRSLWKTDGTEPGTELVSSAPDSMGALFNAGGTLFFYGYDNVHGYELWTSDGTAAGTVLVKDINPGSQQSYLSNLTSVGGILYFTALSPASGYELWRSDGTEAGTYVVRDIVPGSGSSDVRDLIEADGVLYFTASDNVSGRELWKSDGTEAGTIQVADLRPGASSSDPQQLTSSGGKLYFVADSDTDGPELWVSDGTAAGTFQVTDIRTDGYGSYPFQLVDVDGVLFFTANDGTHGQELWKSDGTEAGTVLVKDVVPGSGGVDINSMVNVDGVLFFDNSDGNSDRPHELWKSDGTEAGTLLVKTIAPVGYYYGGIGEMVNYNGTLYFVGNDLVSGDELWMSDGTPEGTILASDLETHGSSYPSLLTVSGGKLFFAATTHATGEELFVLSQATNAPPTDVSLTETTIAEDVAVGAVVGTLDTTDADAGDAFTYTLVDGDGDTDNAAFTIVDNELRTAAALDFETQASYSIRVRTTDAAGDFFERMFTIQVSDVDEFDISEVVDTDATDNAVAENSANGTAVGIMAFASDADGSNNSVIYGLDDDAEGRFVIDPVSGMVTVANGPLLDFEAASSHTVVVRATSSDGSIETQSFVIAVTNVPEEAVIDLSSTSIAENLPKNSVVGSFSATNLGPGAVTYSLVNGEGADNNNSFKVVGQDLVLKPSANFESRSEYSIRVRVRVDGVTVGERTFTITVIDENEGPASLALSNTKIAENNEEGAVIGDFSASDPDAEPGLVYSLVEGTGDTDNSQFAIVGNQLTAVGAFDFEAQKKFSIRIRVTDAGGLKFEKTFTIGITNVNDGPTGILLSKSTIKETAKLGAKVATLKSVDPDGTSPTFTLVAGDGDVDNASFVIDGKSLRLNAELDFETQATYTIRVRVTDAGGLSREEILIITVQDVAGK